MNPIIEAMARAMVEQKGFAWVDISVGESQEVIKTAQAAYDAIIASGHWIVPNEPTETMKINGGVAIENAMFAGQPHCMLIFDVAAHCFSAMKQAAQ